MNNMYNMYNKYNKYNMYNMKKHMFELLGIQFCSV